MGRTKIILLLVKVDFNGEGDWGRCFEIRLAERPGHDVKWQLSMAEMEVNLTGLKAAA